MGILVRRNPLLRIHLPGRTPENKKPQLGPLLRKYTTAAESAIIGVPLDGNDRGEWYELSLPLVTQILCARPSKEATINRDQGTHPRFSRTVFRL